MQPFNYMAIQYSYKLIAIQLSVVFSPECQVKSPVLYMCNVVSLSQLTNTLWVSSYTEDMRKSYQGMPKKLAM